jgi:hypothetical protein
VKVQVDLNPRDLWQLEERAERDGMTLPELLAEMVTSHERPSLSTSDRVRELWRDGMCDADMAVRLRFAPGYVALVRRSLGLPANKRFKKAGK